ncbi:MAG TPA: hypothetical protein VI542_22490 [Candidatus Tectomicrobia bacterium]
MMRSPIGIPLDLTRFRHPFDMEIIALRLGTNIQHGYTIRAEKYLLPFDLHTRPALQLVDDLVAGVV